MIVYGHTETQASQSGRQAAAGPGGGDRDGDGPDACRAGRGVSRERARTSVSTSVSSPARVGTAGFLFRECTAGGTVQSCRIGRKCPDNGNRSRADDIMIVKRRRDFRDGEARFHSISPR